MGSSLWDAKVYLNDEFKTVVRVKNSNTTNEIRGKIFPNNPNNNNEDEDEDEHYFFLNKANNIIIDDQDFTAKDVWKNDESGGYRIDLVTENYFNQESIVNLYVNDIKVSAIKFKGNIDLKKVKELGGNNINKDSLFFLTKDMTIIENINNFKSRDIIIYEKQEIKMNLIDKEYYKRIQLIDHLEKLSKTVEPINWLKQTEFFKKVMDFAGETIANAIIEDLLGKIGTPNKINDKEYIDKFLKLLINKDNIYKGKNNNNIIDNSSINDNIISSSGTFSGL